MLIWDVNMVADASFLINCIESLFVQNVEKEDSVTITQRAGITQEATHTDSILTGSSQQIETVLI